MVELYCCDLSRYIVFDQCTYEYEFSISYKGMTISHMKSSNSMINPAYTRWFEFW